MTRGEVGFEDDDAVAWAELDLDVGETITCTFTNVRSSLVVEKQAPSDPTRDFESIVVPVEANNRVEAMVEIDPTFDLSHGEDETRYVGPGSSFVGEELPEGWSLGVSCGTPLVEEDGYRRRCGGRRGGDVRLHEHAPHPADASAGDGPDNAADTPPL